MDYYVYRGIDLPGSIAPGRSKGSAKRVSFLLLLRKMEEFRKKIEKEKKKEKLFNQKFFVVFD